MQATHAWATDRMEEHAGKVFPVHAETKRRERKLGYMSTRIYGTKMKLTFRDTDFVLKLNNFFGVVLKFVLQCLLTVLEVRLHLHIKCLQRLDCVSQDLVLRFRGLRACDSGCQVSVLVNVKDSKVVVINGMQTR